MKILFNISLILVGVFGFFVSLMSDIIVDSTVVMINGMDLSMALAVFSVVVFINGIYNLFST